METVLQFAGVPREELIKMVVDSRSAAMESSRQLEWLKRQLDWFKRQLFGQKSERLVDENPDQLELPLEMPESVEPEPDTVIVPAHVKRKPGKGKGMFTLTLPEDIPVEETLHELPEEKRICLGGCRQTRAPRERVLLEKKHLQKIRCSRRAAFRGDPSSNPILRFGWI
jgi:hypothetical protein